MNSGKVAATQFSFNGVPPPKLDLPIPSRPQDITDNLLKLVALAPDARTRFVFEKLVTHTHRFLIETKLTEEEWAASIAFLNKTGETCSPATPWFDLISGMFGITTIVDMIKSNKQSAGALGSGKLAPTEYTILGPAYLENAPEVVPGGSIMSGGDNLLFMEGRVLDISGDPISNALVDAWETDEKGLYDIQYVGGEEAMDFRGRVRTDADGRYRFRAIVPIAYPSPTEGPIADIRRKLGWHNMRPSHMHLKVIADGYQPLITQLFPKGDPWIESDGMFAVKASLVVDLKDIDEAEVKRRGYKDGGSGKLVEFDIVLTPALASE